MKPWEKITLMSLLACMLVLIGTMLLLPASGSTAGINLMAVNDSVMETTAENMPFTAGGVLYVPYSMLSSQASGINLGVNAMYNNTRRTVLVTDIQRGVTFDLQNNTAEDIRGNPVSARAMVRNTTVFLPIDWLCQYFGAISCTRTRTPYGTLVRITNSAAVLGDQDFADAASPQLSDNLRRYLEARDSTSDSDPYPSGDVEPSSNPSGAELFLALRPGTRAQDCAHLLESRGQRALFLFTCEELTQEGDLVRRVVGAGHTVGLELTSEDAASCLAEAKRGRDLLAASAKYNALVVSAPDLDREGRETLKQAGFAVWSTTVQGDNFSSGAALVRGLDTRRVNFVELECGAAGLSLLRSALNAMEEENCQIYQATAPVLS